MSSAIDPNRYVQWGGTFQFDSRVILPASGVPLVRKYIRYYGWHGRMPYVVTTKTVGLVTRSTTGSQLLVVELFEHARIPTDLTYDAEHRIFVGVYSD